MSPRLFSGLSFKPTASDQAHSLERIRASVYATCVLEPSTVTERSARGAAAARCSVRVDLDPADLLQQTIVAGAVFQFPFQNAYLICMQCRPINKIKAHDIGARVKTWRFL
jgi:hypothetical protein